MKKFLNLPLLFSACLLATEMKNPTLGQESDNFWDTAKEYLFSNELNEVRGFLRTNEKKLSNAILESFLGEAKKSKYWGPYSAVSLERNLGDTSISFTAAEVLKLKREESLDVGPNLFNALVLKKAALLKDKADFASFENEIQKEALILKKKAPKGFYGRTWNNFFGHKPSYRVVDGKVEVDYEAAIIYEKLLNANSANHKSAFFASYILRPLETAAEYCYYPFRRLHQKIINKNGSLSLHWRERFLAMQKDKTGILKNLVNFSLITAAVFLAGKTGVLAAAQTSIGTLTNPVMLSIAGLTFLGVGGWFLGLKFANLLGWSSFFGWGLAIVCALASVVIGYFSIRKFWPNTAYDLRKAPGALKYPLVLVASCFLGSFVFLSLAHYTIKVMGLALPLCFVISIPVSLLVLIITNKVLSKWARFILKRDSKLKGWFGKIFKEETRSTWIVKSVFGVIFLLFAYMLNRTSDRAVSLFTRGKQAPTLINLP